MTPLAPFRRAASAGRALRHHHGFWPSARMIMTEIEARHGGRAPAGGAGRLGRVTDVIRVDDPADPRLADYLRLTDSSLRTSLEAANGLFIAEGEKVIRRAMGAGYPVRSLLGDPGPGGRPGRSGRGGPGVRHCARRRRARSPATGFTGERWRRWRGGRCPGWAMSWPATTGSWCWRILSITGTWARSSGARPPWGWGRWFWPPGARIRSTGGRSRCRWARSSPSPTRG